ncbi:MAG: GC-type dockerin domain-anchored protein [Planctomycetota bacterium]|nr:GC-type dockerin domain-anchored protein [Planctomycetota bacterium]
MRHLIATVGTAALLAGTATAATINVPGDYPTIQEAVDAAVNGDEILVAQGVYTGSNDNVVEITDKAISLRALNPKPDATVIDGEGERQGIRCVGADTNGTVIEGFTLTNAQSDDGGAVSIQSTNVVLMGCTLTGNTASTDGGGVHCLYGDVDITACRITDNFAEISGGGIFIRYGSANITNCEILGNSVNQFGGGIYARNSEITILDTTISTNLSDNSGGGLLLLLCESSLEVCTIDSNTSGTGAGLRVLGPDPCTMMNCTITNNQALDVGGGLESATANPTLVNTVSCGNTPQNILGIWTDGGGNCTSSFSCQDTDQDGLPDECTSVGDGLHEVPSEFPTIQEAVIVAGNSDTILVSPGIWTGTDNSVINPNGKQLQIQSKAGPDSTILDGEGMRTVISCVGGENQNTVFDGFTITGGSNYSGGGIQCISSSPRFIDCLITENNANDYGGGLYSNGGSPHLENCVFQNNLADNNGGGAYCTGGAPTFTNCDISQNGAVDGGGGLSLLGTAAVMTECTITYNGTGGPGGGLDCSNSDATLNLCTIANNATMATGGGVYSSGGSNVFTECMMTENLANDGGGVTLLSSMSSFTGCTIGNNTAAIAGGIYANGGAPMLVDSIITGNSATDFLGDGGGINLRYSNMELVNCLVVGNSCGDLGGGIFAFGSSPTVSHCELLSNQSKSGGGLYCDQSHATITDSVFSSNMATADGGGFYATSSTPSIADSRFNANHVDGNGAGLYLVNSSPLVTNCLIHDNMADGNSSDGGGIHCYVSDAEFNGCTIWNNSATERGGGLFCRINSSPLISNCTIATNTAGSGGGIYSLQTDPFIAGSTLCGNTPENIEGNYLDGDGNSFLDICTPDCPGDVDGNGVVDVNDVLLLVEAWNTANYEADLDGDGLVDADDVLILLSHYGESCP